LRRLAAIVAAGLVLAGCHGSSHPLPRTVTLPPSPTALPQFDLAAFQQLLTKLRGKPVVVNIWASWCGPCIKEAPVLAGVSRTFQGRVQFLGVDTNDHVGLARAFIAKYGIGYPSVFDPPQSILHGMGFVGPPDTIVFNANGGRAMVWSGPTFTAAQLSQELTKLTA
jgi:cytochrome c biogenesis protein CcmG/thiol:disulfide interchange protein DsbE